MQGNEAREDRRSSKVGFIGTRTGWGRELSDPLSSSSGGRDVGRRESQSTDGRRDRWRAAGDWSPRDRSPSFRRECFISRARRRQPSATTNIVGQVSYLSQSNGAAPPLARSLSGGLISQPDSVAALYDFVDSTQPGIDWLRADCDGLGSGEAAGGLVA